MEFADKRGIFAEWRWRRLRSAARFIQATSADMKNVPDMMEIYRPYLQYTFLPLDATKSFTAGL